MIRAYLLGALFSVALYAGPTSVFWTNCSTTCVPPDAFKASLSNYFSVCGKGSFPPDLAIEYGLLAAYGITGEIGVDYICGNHDPFFFNGKLSMREGTLFSHAPSISIGLFNAGTKTHGKNRTNQNIVDCVLGHSLPKPLGGVLYLGAFSGSRAMGKDRQGIMAAFNRPFHQAHDANGRHYAKWVFSADYATGKNTIGGGGVSMTYYFTPTINVQTGPIWFNSKKINGSWKWSIQIVVVF